MRLENKYASDLTSKDKNLALAAAKHIIETADMQAWQCFVENSDNIFDFIKQNIAKYFAEVINENNYKNLFELFKIHSFDWDECFIQLLLRFSYSNDELLDKMLYLLQNGSEDEKAYAAKFFSFVPNEKANYYLFDAYSINYEPLKYNAAKALGDASDLYSYNYYINKLASADDWEKIDAAQFLQWYGNKKAYPILLKTMSESSMPEHIAGSVAMLDNISHYFNVDDKYIRDLSLDCYQILITSLGEVWPLSTILDFEIYECVETLISLINENQDKQITSRYSTLLLKTKTQFDLLNSDEYKFGEDKYTIEALENILELLNEGSQNFWQMCTSLLENEIAQENSQRIIYALDVISDYGLNFYVPKIKALLTSDYAQDVIYEAVVVLAGFSDFNGLDNDNILDLFTDVNLKTMAASLINK